MVAVRRGWPPNGGILTCLPPFYPVFPVTLSVLASLAAVALIRADYPLASHRYLTDPAATGHDGRVHVYCSNDDDNPVVGGYQMQSLVCVSSSDMKNWTDHGEIIRVPHDASRASNS